jgi:hypothetical protein
MLDLVFWFSSVALAPWALGLAWKLISGVAGLMGPASPTESAAPTRGPGMPAAFGDPSQHRLGRIFSYAQEGVP